MLDTTLEQHRADPHVLVRIYAASSFGELPERYPNPFRQLHFPNGR